VLMLKPTTDITIEQRQAYADLMIDAMKRSGKTYKQIAESAGVDTHVVSDTQHGLRSKMSLFYQALLWRELGISPNEAMAAVGLYERRGDEDFRIERIDRRLREASPEVLDLVEKILELK
jgi:hypothetical protein